MDIYQPPAPEPFTVANIAHNAQIPNSQAFPAASGSHPEMPATEDQVEVQPTRFPFIITSEFGKMTVYKVYFIGKKTRRI